MPLMECIMLDLHKAQLPEHKDWFKETREARFGPLNKASSQYTHIRHYAVSWQKRAPTTVHATTGRCREPILSCPATCAVL